MAKPCANLRVITCRGTLSIDAVLRPLPALITSHITAGSSPDFTPNTTASAVAAIAVAESRLFASFIVWPMPGRSPMKNTLPKTASIGSSSVQSARGPATITASVPATAPATPPLTGESTAVMPFAASAAAISRAAVAPVVERSITVFTFDPPATPPAPSATSRTIGGVGRLSSTVSTAEATAADDAAARAPFAVERSDRLRADVVHDELVAGGNEPQRHRLAHPAEPDETDLLGHDLPPAVTTNTARQENDSTAAVAAFYGPRRKGVNVARRNGISRCGATSARCGGDSLVQWTRR